jgi:COP9 signalosome complex subunit 1
VVSFFGLLQVINNSSFKAFLELLPWLRELITDFYSSNYASCLQVLEKMKVCLLN